MAVFVLAALPVLGLALVPDSGVAAAQKAAGPSRKVTLDFVQTDVHIVAKALSIQSGRNVVLMPSVKGGQAGQVTIRLTDVSVEDAIQQIAAAVGATVREVRGTYFVGTPDELRALLGQSGRKESVALEHAPPAQVREMLRAALPLLTVEAVGNAKMLILSGTEEDLAEARRLIAAADVALPEPPKVQPPPPPVTRDVYKVKFVDAATLASNLSRTLPALKVEAVDGTLVLEGTAAEQQMATKLISALDVEGVGTRSIVRAYRLKYLHPIQASETLTKLFAEKLTVQPGFDSYTPAQANFRPLSVETQRAFGSAGGGGGGGGEGGGAGGGAAGGAAGQALTGPGSRARVVILAGPSELVDQATQVLAELDEAPQQIQIEARVVDISPEASKQLGFLYNWSPLGFRENDSPDAPPGAFTRPGFNIGRFNRSPFQFDVTLEALEQKRDARLLARPNISVVDGEEASIFIGDILRYERLQSVTETGQIFTIETVPVGVALLVRPRITDGEITMKIHPVVSNVTGFTGRNRDIPVTASREAESTIRLRDGETFAIGGLIREEDIKILTKVPILGDIPFFGELFRNRNTSKRRSEVTVFLTARIVKP